MYTHVTLVLAVSDITYAYYEHVLDCVCFNVPTADSPNPLNVWDHGLYAILIRETTKCVHEVETYCKYYSVQLTSLNKKGKRRTQSSRGVTLLLTLTVSYHMCYEHVLDYIMIICLLQNLPTLTYVRPRTIRLPMCGRSGNVLYILFCVVDFSPQKKGETKTRSSRTQSYSGIPLLHFDKLDTSRTVERGDVYFPLYQKGRGTDTVLVLSQVQCLDLRIKSFNIGDLRKTLSSRKYLSPSRKRNGNVLLQKKRGVARTQW